MGIFDSVVVGAIILALFLGGMFSVYIYHQITDKVEAELVGSGALSQEIADDIFGGSNTAINTFVNLIPFVALMLYVASLVTSYLTRNNPVFIFFSVFFVALGIILTVIEKNVFDKIVATFPAIAAEIPLAAWYFSNATVIAAVFGVANILVAYLAYQLEG